MIFSVKQWFVAVENNLHSIHYEEKLCLFRVFSIFRKQRHCEVRNVLKGLKAIAEETGVTFLLIQHTGKADRENMQQRVLGATGIVASCRASFCLFTDKETGNRIFAPMKNNLAVDPTSVVFTIDKTVKGGQVQVIDWELQKSADDIADEMREAYQHGRGRKPKESTEAENWLHDFLSDGRKPTGKVTDPEPGTVRYESGQAGHTWRTIERAKTSLNVISERELNIWFWSLPNLPNSTEQDRQNANLEKQDRQNTFSATSGTESQADVSGGEANQDRQICVCSDNSGGLEQPDDSEQKPLNNVLNSNFGEIDENGRHKVKALPRRRPRREGITQQQPETDVTPCDQQRDLF